MIQVKTPTIEKAWFFSHTLKTTTYLQRWKKCMRGVHLHNCLYNETSLFNSWNLKWQRAQIRRLTVLLSVCYDGRGTLTWKRGVDITLILHQPHLPTQTTKHKHAQVAPPPPPPDILNSKTTFLQTLEKQIYPAVLSVRQEMSLFGSLWQYYDLI